MAQWPQRRWEGEARTRVNKYVLDSGLSFLFHINRGGDPPFVNLKMSGNRSVSQNIIVMCHTPTIKQPPAPFIQLPRNFISNGRFTELSPECEPCNKLVYPASRIYISDSCTRASELFPNDNCFFNCLFSSNCIQRAIGECTQLRAPQ